MGIDKNGDTIIKKEFWADGIWYAAFLLIPLALSWVIIIIILIYGAYFTLYYEPAKLQVVFFFILFSALSSVAVAALIKSVWTIFTEKIVIANDQITYSGFGSYSLPYRSIKRVALKETSGPFGKERFLFFVGPDGVGNEGWFLIPRWKSLSGGVLTRELEKRTQVSLFNRSLLTFYISFHGKEWWLPVTLAVSAIILIFSFLIARGAPEKAATLTVLLWLFLESALIFFIARYINRKKGIVAHT